MNVKTFAQLSKAHITSILRAYQVNCLKQVSVVLPWCACFANFCCGCIESCNDSVFCSEFAVDVYQALGFMSVEIDPEKVRDSRIHTSGHSTNIKLFCTCVHAHTRGRARARTHTHTHTHTGDPVRLPRRLPWIPEIWQALTSQGPQIPRWPTTHICPQTDNSHLQVPARSARSQKHTPPCPERSRLGTTSLIRNYLQIHMARRKWAVPRLRRSSPTAQVVP